MPGQRKLGKVGHEGTAEDRGDDFAAVTEYPLFFRLKSGEL